MNFDTDHSPIITELVYIHEPSTSDWSFPLHQHADRLELSYVAEGCVDCYLDGLTKRLNAGDLLIKNAGMIHSEKKISQSELKEICISFDHVHLNGLPENHMIEEGLLPVLHVDKKPVIRELFFYLKEHYFDLPAFLKAETGNVLFSLICHHMPEMSYDSPDKKENTAQTIRNVRTYLDQNYARKISLDELGDMFYISPFYLTRQFKKYTGYTVKQYILDLQMGEAENLLLFSDLSIKEIASRCGYENLQYFYTLFKKYAHCTPVEYRRQYKKT